MEEMAVCLDLAESYPDNMKKPLCSEIKKDFEVHTIIRPPQ